MMLGCTCHPFFGSMHINAAAARLAGCCILHPASCSCVCAHRTTHGGSIVETTMAGPDPPGRPPRDAAAPRALRHAIQAGPADRSLDPFLPVWLLMASRIALHALSTRTDADLARGFIEKLQCARPRGKSYSYSYGGDNANPSSPSSKLLLALIALFLSWWKDISIWGW